VILGNRHAQKMHNQRSMQTLHALQHVQALRRRPDAHKGDAGKVLLVGGAASMAGALVLSGLGALYSGAGWTQLMMLDTKSAHLVPTQPELMVHQAQDWEPQQALEHIRPDVVAIGPGLGTSAQALAWLQAGLQWTGLLVLDADALNLLALHPTLFQQLPKRGDVCITPHPGEAARLLQTTNHIIQADRTSALTSLVSLTNSVVVLKGHHTLLASPQHKAQQCSQGNPGMAVAGMGDVLTGCIAALAAQGVRHGLNLWEAAGLGVQLHASAGDQLQSKGVGPIGMTPRELALEIRTLLNEQL
jgi:hydroxyethylthiazole kinase-like uncharacterized protein yjeF